MREEEDETIFTLSDRAKGSGGCFIMIPQLLKTSLPLLLWVDIYFMITQEKYLEGSSCTSYSISLSDNGFLQMPTAKMKKKKKEKEKLLKGELLCSVYSRQLHGYQPRSDVLLFKLNCQTSDGSLMLHVSTHPDKQKYYMTLETEPQTFASR